MRRLGRTDPGRAGGDSGHFANICRPNATVDANATESCFLRVAMSTGRAVSASSEGAATGVAAAGAAGTGGFLALLVESTMTAARPPAESVLVVPLGVADGVASC